MSLADETVTVARHAPHRRLAPAVLAVAAGAVILSVWGVTLSHSLTHLVRAVPAQFVPAMTQFSQARTDLGEGVRPLGQFVGAVNAQLQAREAAQAAFAAQVKVDLSKHP